MNPLAMPTRARFRYPSPVFGNHTVRFLLTGLNVLTMAYTHFLTACPLLPALAGGARAERGAGVVAPQGTTPALRPHAAGESHQHQRYEERLRRSALVTKRRLAEEPRAQDLALRQMRRLWRVLLAHAHLFTGDERDDVMPTEQQPETHEVA